VVRGYRGNQLFRIGVKWLYALCVRNYYMTMMIVARFDISL
jgi:hypothetical protein